MYQRYSYSGEGDGLLGPPERRRVLRQAAILALMLTLPALPIYVLAAAYPKERLDGLLVPGLVWALTTGWATLPWSFAAEVVQGLFERSSIASACAMIIGIWVSYLINAMFALTRWTARQLFYVVGVTVVLQLVVMLGTFLSL